uniref:Transmembrane protein 256 homolog n=1 Tax=Coccolithus braarudii TaxID=221442 RepID=A0A6T7KJ55_9EUKA|mmetsp:Transcript_5860/g.12810  ORF Transcript_5860/g.12810 Transcript_5860/m.12810 type:complete len:111 (+) Transcript_5860:93-425(+)
MATVFGRLGGISGASAIGAAAYGAHGFKPSDKTLVTSFENAQRMHLVHSVMLAVSPRLPRPMLSGSLFALGTAMFSGSCYAVALSGNRSYSKLAPAGGVTLMLAWLTIAL